MRKCAITDSENINPNIISEIPLKLNLKNLKSTLNKGKNIKVISTSWTSRDQWSKLKERKSLGTNSSV